MESSIYCAVFGIVLFLQIVLTNPIPGQCSHFMPRKHTRKPKLFWCFLAYEIRALARNSLENFVGGERNSFSFYQSISV